MSRNNKDMLINQRYELGKILGSGGMGTVYLGVDTHNQTPVAIKRLNVDSMFDRPDRLERFQREGEVLRELNHPNIVKMLDRVELDGQHYLIMEYVSGGDLRQLLAEHSARDELLPITRCLEIALDLADALTRTHRLNVIHRDLKPANILLAEDGTPRLTDFGVAHVGDKERMTETGIAMGTVEYLPPEALNNEAADSSADIWAFGILLFEMLAGHTPFSREGVAATLTAILLDPLPDLEALRPDAPTALVDLVYRMLDRDRQQRIRSVRRIGLELEALLQGENAADSVFHDTNGHISDSNPAQWQSISHNLPAQTTSFVGRESELETISKLLHDADTRLVTVLGYGGMGKTRLALEAARRLIEIEPQAAPFAQGVFFVSLAPINSPDLILSTLADAIGFTFYSAEDPQQQILDYLREKSMLLLIDNFEHVISGADLVARVLETAPSIKVLATSRERLNLHGETLLNIAGMEFPAWETPEDVLEYSGVKLFMHGAQRVKPGFSLDEADLPYLARICNLVQGMPLGIELAAAWVDTLPLHEIATEIQRNVDFLASDIRDLPPRHRSVRAVFDYSWAMLSEPERDLLSKLSVFRGGFTRDAAMEITGSSLRTLVNLVNKSLLSRDPDGRFQVHELLRQFAAEFLTQSGQESSLQAAHADYYAQLVFDAFKDMSQLINAAAVGGLMAELDNIRTAWRLAVDQTDVRKLHLMVLAMHSLYQVRGNYLEGVDSLGEAITSCEALPQTVDVVAVLIEMLTAQGWLLIRLGEIDRAAAAFQRGIDLMALAVPRPGSEDPISGLAMVRSIAGDYTEAIQLGLEGLDYNLQRDDELSAMVSYYTLTSASMGLGDYAKALEYSQESLRLAEKYNQPWFQSYTHIDLGHIARIEGRYAEAREHYQISYDIRRGLFGDPEGVAVSLRTLAELALEEGDAEEARTLMTQSLAIYEDLGDRGGLATILTSLGMALSALGDYAGSWIHLRRALRMTAAMQLPPLILSTLLGIGDLLLHQGQATEGRALLVLVLEHPLSSQRARDEARDLLHRHHLKPPATAGSETVAALDSVVADLLQRENLL